MYLISDPDYLRKYTNFLLTPPVKTGKCFGLCITWLKKCLESEINNKTSEKYLRLYINGDFFWESFSMQRLNTSLSTCNPSVKFDFLRRMENENIVRRQNNLRYELEFSLFNTEGKEILTRDFFKGVIATSLFGIVIGLRKSQDYNKPQATGHAIALLQIKDKRYLFNPNYGVFNVTSCSNLRSALIKLACISGTSFSYRLSPRSEAIGVIPRLIT